MRLFGVDMFFLGKSRQHFKGMLSLFIEKKLLFKFSFNSGLKLTSL